MSSVVSRYWAPAVLGVASTAAWTFAINFIGDGKPGWWWIVLVLGVLGTAGSLVWTYIIQRSDAGGEGGDKSVAQQSAVGNTGDVSIRADNGSAAAWQMGTVNMGKNPDDPKTTTQ